MSHRRNHQRSLRGISLIEAMLVLVTLAIVGLGAGVGLQSVSKNPDQVEASLWASQQIASTIENLRDTAYASLASGSKASDPDHNGKTYTITWTVLEIDPALVASSPATAKANSGLKQITVSLNNYSAVTWIAQ